VSQEAENASRPVDVIFVIDNSSSMEGEIAQVQQRINEDFADIIQSSGVDYRVIMVSRYGDIDQSVGDSDVPICIGGSLGGQDCTNPMGTPLQNNAPFFYHYSADIRSREPWCRLLEGFSNPDELSNEGNRPWTSIAPNGWGEFLRPEARKAFVVITDDDSRCGVDAPDYNNYQSIGGRPFDVSFDDENSEGEGSASAVAFDNALLRLSPEQFGTAEDRNYVWHSIVGMAANDPPSAAWQPGAGVQTGTCQGGGGSEGPGTGFQALSRLTGGLRYPSCRNDDFNAIFREIAGGVVAGALSCEWGMPLPPEGRELNPNQVNMLYRPGTGDPQLIGAVPSADDCGDGGWYFDSRNNPSAVVVCDSTCDVLKADPDGRVDIVFGCQTETVAR
jgi:hypothetical protein